MSLKVIGVGVGRTGTYSLRLAINHLGLGPCHHMEEVLHNQAHQVPLWVEAVKGKADWRAIYDGYESAVDWPTAGFHRELVAAFPSARFVLTTRSPEGWASSFTETICKVIATRNEAPAPMQAWLEMCNAVISRTGFPPGLDDAALMKAFAAHQSAVRAAIPADRLLVYQVKEGWGPLCAFLGVPVPAAAFPRTNDRAEFWDIVAGKKQLTRAL